MKKARIEYIDALRGFTMILVVLTHVESFSFEMESSFINDVLVSFRMPLFFFISGFIGYKAGVEWTGKTWWTMTRKKLLVQLIPTFFFGLICAYAYLKVDFMAFVTSSNKLGYWFTIALLEMFLLVYTMNWVLYQCSKKESKPRKVIALVLIYVVLYLCRLIPDHLPSLSTAYDVLCLHYVSLYFPFFAFGYICSMYKEALNRMLEHKYFAAIAIILFAVLFYVRRTYILPNLGGGALIFISSFFTQLAVGILGLLVVYNTFRTYADSFTSDKRVGRALQYIGKRTLDIYLLHYFFIPYLPQVGRMLEQGNNATLELALGGGISLLVIGICLVVSNVLRTSPILAKYLFGAKTNH